MIGCLLLIADYLYFTAIAQEDALIAVISPIATAPWSSVLSVV